MRYAIILLALLIAAPAWGGQAAKRMLRVSAKRPSSSVTFTSSQSWTVPANITSDPVQVTVIGGGGGGGAPGGDGLGCTFTNTAGSPGGTSSITYSTLSATATGGGGGPRGTNSNNYATTGQANTGTGADGSGSGNISGLTATTAAGTGGLGGTGAAQNGGNGGKAGKLTGYMTLPAGGSVSVTVGPGGSPGQLCTPNAGCTQGVQGTAGAAGSVTITYWTLP